MNADWNLVPRKEETIMTNSRSLVSTQSVESATSINHFHRRLVVCLVLTVFNAIVIVTFAGTLYHATTNNSLQRAGVTLLLTALFGSLARVWLLALRSRTR